jgi:hypothetical protein
VIRSVVKTPSRRHALALSNIDTGRTENWAEKNPRPFSRRGGVCIFDGSKWGSLVHGVHWFMGFAKFRVHAINRQKPTNPIEPMTQ